MSRAYYNKKHRDRYLLVRPSSKLCIGPFKRFVHAFLHLRQIDESIRCDWFIGAFDDYPEAADCIILQMPMHGWVQLEQPIKMRYHRD